MTIEELYKLFITHIHSGSLPDATRIPKLERLARGNIGEVRQTVLSGGLDANGNANFISAGTGLNVTISASLSAPIIASASGGIDQNGDINYIIKKVKDITLLLPASSTSYIYYELFGQSYVEYSTTIQPIYSQIYPATPSTGQYCYIIPKGKMYKYDGSNWIETIAVFTGQATTDATSVTTVVTYALRGKYVKTIASVSVNTDYTITHNIGIGDFVEVSALIDATGQYGHKSFAYPTSFYDGSGRSFTALAYPDSNGLSVTFGSLFAVNVAGTTSNTISVDSVTFFVKRGW